MSKLNAWKSILSVLLVGLLGFTGQERYIELEGFLNGRSSARFRAQDRNVRAVLSKGTRAEILKIQRLPSGNYGVLVKTINGAHAGESFWVYYKNSQPVLKLYEKAPASWRLAKKKRAAETVRDVGVYRNPKKPAAGVDGAAADILKQMEKANTQVQTPGVNPEVRPEDCASCVAAQTPIPSPRPDVNAETILENATRKETVQSRIQDDKRGATHPNRMAYACYKFVRHDGSYGDWGQTMAAIMKESKFKQFYTKPSALGAFCPKFNSLSEDQKIQAWTWFWGSLGSEESGCGLKKEHRTMVQGLNGVWKVNNPVPGYGIWALEKSPLLREGRGPECQNINTLAGQARCAIHIMVKNQLSKGNTASAASLKYWGPTLNNRKARQIMPLMERFTPCF